jgi:hypothetical protein
MIGLQLKKSVIIAVAWAFMGIGTESGAATIAYVGSTQGTDFKITVDDNTAGQINFVVQSTANPNNADLYALGFNWSGATVPSTTIDPGDFNTVSSNTGETISAVCASCSNAGNGANFNGTNQTFDFIVRMGSSGTQASNFLTDFRFYVASTLSLNDALGSGLGIRAQTTGPNGQDSIKLVDFTTFAPVPLPAGGLLLIAALGGLGLTRRLRKS